MLGKKLSDYERKQSEIETKEILQNRKIVRTVKVKISKDYYMGYIARDKSGTLYNIKKVIKNPKARQNYILSLNEYDKVIDAKKILA